MNSVTDNASALQSKIKLHGNHNENEVNHIIKAGRLSMIYERGNLRHISIGNIEVLRMIYPSVRAKEWLTINPVISNEEFEINPDSFMISYTSSYKSGDIDFIMKCKIEGMQDSSLIIYMEGEALSNFEKNRIGFCILHPVKECAGKNCVITHSNSLSENSIFPQLVSPTRPFTDISRMKWGIAGNECILNFQGDVFETEDQRNWTDASYKTYSTPIKLPYPVRISKGERIIQRVELNVIGDPDLNYSEEDIVKISSFPDQKSPVPMIGIGKSSRSEPLSQKEINSIETLRFDHYRIDVHLFKEWKSITEISVKEAADLDYGIEFALFADNDFSNQISEFLHWIKGQHLHIEIVNIYHKDSPSTPMNILDEIGPAVREALPGVKIVAGTNANFAQLNKTRPDSDFMDYIGFSLQPQEHAGDNLTLVENLQGQSYAIETANSFKAGKAVWISPVNIQRRFNANSGFYEQEFQGKGFPPQVDSRIMSLFGACWTVGSLKYIIESGVKGITYYETVGERGIVQGDQPSQWPENFQSVSGMFFPAWFVFRFLLQYKSFDVIKSESTKPLKVNSIVLMQGEEIRMMVVNFTDVQQNAFINFPAHSFTLKQLNENTYANAAGDPDWLSNTSAASVKNNSLLLEPYSVSFIE